MSCITDTGRAEKELDFRTNDGLEVALLWNDCDTSLIVEVVDTKTLDAFRVEVAATEALDAFRHPYAYAAFRSVEYIEPRRLHAEQVSA